MRRRDHSGPTDGCHGAPTTATAAGRPSSGSSSASSSSTPDQHPVPPGPAAASPTRSSAPRVTPAHRPPSNVLRGQGVCSTCAGNDTAAARRQFLSRVRAAGAEPALGANWNGVDTPYPLICAAGHLCTPRPHHVNAGGGLCRTCAGQDSQAVHAQFLRRVQALGGSPAPTPSGTGSTSRTSSSARPGTAQHRTRTRSWTAAGCAASAVRRTTGCTCSGTRTVERSRSASAASTGASASISDGATSLSRCGPGSATSCAWPWKRPPSSSGVWRACHLLPRLPETVGPRPSPLTSARRRGRS
jgi:hypothetical protein